MSETLEDRLAEALRDTRAYMSADQSPTKDEVRYHAVEVLAEYDAKTRKPDAAERAMVRIYDPVRHTHIRMDETWNSWGAKIIREEYAKDNAERDARDREREDSVEACRGMHATFGCKCDQCEDRLERVRRAFGWTT